jgi:hypothetical protein
MLQRLQLTIAPIQHRDITPAKRKVCNAFARVFIAHDDFGKAQTA